MGNHDPLSHDRRVATNSPHPCLSSNGAKFSVSNEANIFESNVSIVSPVCASNEQMISTCFLSSSGKKFKLSSVSCSANRSRQQTVVSLPSYEMAEILNSDDPLLINDQSVMKVGNFLPAGRLKFFKSRWKQFTDDPLILSLVTGYKIEFSTPPLRNRLKRFASHNLNHLTIFQEEISSLFNKGAICSVKCRSEIRFCANLFLVPKKTGDLRPVINLKPFNQFVTYRKFKLESVAAVANFLRQGDFVTFKRLRFKRRVFSCTYT